MRTWLRGTRARLTLAYAGVFIIIAGLAAAAFYAYLSSLESAAIDDSLTAQAQSLSSGIDTNNGRITFRGGDTLPNETTQGIAVDALLVDSRAGVLDSSGLAPPIQAVAPLVAPALATDQAIFTTVPIRGVEQRLRAQRVSIGAGQSVVLVVGRSTAEQVARLERIAILLVLVVIALAAAASTLGYIVAGRALRPVRVIAATARDLSEHDLHRRIDLGLPPDELGELGATFNEMLERLEAGFTSLQRFTADAAHELRAPLAVMLSEVEVALREPRDAGSYRLNLVNLRSEIQRLARLADHLLVLARADAGVLRPSLSRLDAPDFLEEIVARWRPLVSARGLHLDSDLPDAGHLDADAELLRRVIDNLIDNAVKYTPPGGQIRIEARLDDRRWSITVGDTGPGLRAEARSHLFERFSRGDMSRGRDSGGAGLGLALSAAIVRAHGGTIEIDPATGGGSRFIVSLPATAGP